MKTNLPEPAYQLCNCKKCNNCIFRAELEGVCLACKNGVHQD
ncbi:MAG: hypothetical protein V3V58_02110 [Nitrosopumilaceae archaeon]